jgi:hypothetical protein
MRAATVSNENEGQGFGKLVLSFVFLSAFFSPLLGGRAGAQTGESEPPSFGDKGHVAISAERMFGYVHATQTESGTGVATFTSTNNSISLLGSPIIAVSSIYTFPRIAFDVFAAAGFSVGASLSYFHLSQTTGSASATSTGSSSTTGGFVAAPRIGFAARLAPSVSLWPRAGITYVYASTDNSFGTTQTTYSFHVFAATIEAPLAVSVSPRSLILIGPTADIALSGYSKTSPGTGGTSTTTKETDYGLQAGFLLFL